MILICARIPKNSNGREFSGMYVCVCNAVTERQVQQAINAGAVTAAQLKRELNIATRCGSCGDCLNDYLAQTVGHEAADLNFAAVD